MAKTAKKISEFEKLVETKNTSPEDVSIYWFVARGSTLKGPFSQAELSKKMNSQEVTSFDYAWRQGFHEWRPIGSIPEFEAPQAKSKFENYPSLPVPGHVATAPVARDNEGFPSSTSKKRKDVEVRLRTTNKQLLTPRQATVLVLFAILVSYVTNSWFQKQVLRNVSVFFQNRTAGRTLTLGENSPHAVAPEFWTPLYSAPSFSDIRENIKLPTKVYGIGHMNGENYKIEGQKIDVTPDWVATETQFSELDPIFVRPVEVIGKLNVRDPNQIRVKQLGEPFLENIWEK